MATQLASSTPPPRGGGAASEERTCACTRLWQVNRRGWKSKKKSHDVAGVRQVLGCHCKRRCGVVWCGALLACLLAAFQRELTTLTTAEWGYKYPLAWEAKNHTRKLFYFSQRLHSRSLSPCLIPASISLSSVCTHTPKHISFTSRPSKHTHSLKSRHKVLAQTLTLSTTLSLHTKLTFTLFHFASRLFEFAVVVVVGTGTGEFLARWEKKWVRGFKRGGGGRTLTKFTASARVCKQCCSRQIFPVSITTTVIIHPVSLSHTHTHPNTNTDPHVHKWRACIAADRLQQQKRKCEIWTTVKIIESRCTYHRGTKIY